MLLIALVVLPAANVHAEDVHIYLIGGQSNATGRGNAADISPDSVLAKPQTDIEFFYSKRLNAGNTVLPTSQIVDLAPGSGHGIVKPVYQTEFGPEVSFGRTLADAFPEQSILLVKFTVGGTSLRGGWSENGGIYKRFAVTVREAVAAVEKRGDTPKMMGMIWIQGESDTGRKKYADQYEENLKALIERVRKDFFSKRDAPFVLSQLSDNQFDELKAGHRAVRQAQEKVTLKIPNTALVVTDSDELFTTRKGDKIHFDANGQINLGVALGKKMIEQLDK